MTSSQIIETLFQKYRRDAGWISVAEVALGDWQKGIQRRVDFAALSFWYDNTCDVAEVKVSRQDFLNELKNPEKRQPGFDNSSRAWFVCAPGVCEEAEVPEGWGYMQCNENCHLKVIRDAPERPFGGLQARFVARFLERSTDPIPETYRVYLTFGGQQIGAHEFQGIVLAEVQKVMRKRSARSILQELYRKCYDCSHSSGHVRLTGWTARVHDQMEEWVGRLLDEAQDETVLDGAFDFDG